MIRDITIVPDKQAVIGIDRDDLYMMTGSGFGDPASYKLSELRRGTHTVATAGAAVSFNPPEELRVLHVSHAKNELGSFDLETRKVETIAAITAQSRVLQPADAVVSADGNTLWVSDLRSNSIARFRKKGFLPPVAPTVTPPTINAQEQGATTAASGAGTGDDRGADPWHGAGGDDPDGCTSDRASHSSRRGTRHAAGHDFAACRPAIVRDPPGHGRSLGG